MGRKIKLSPYIAERIERKSHNFRVDTFCAGGKGGSNQNATQSGVRITDLITGLSAEGRNERDQPQNKKQAFERLVIKMIDYYRKEELAQAKAKLPEGSIRTYNIKRNQVKDNRTGASYPLDDILNGELDKMMEDLLLLKERLSASDS